MSAPRSVWVLVWPDGLIFGIRDSYDAAEHVRKFVEPSAVVVRYDVAGLRDSASPRAVSTLTPPAASTADVAPGLQQGSLAIPASLSAVEAGDHEQHDGGAV